MEQFDLLPVYTIRVPGTSQAASHSHAADQATYIKKAARGLTELSLSHLLPLTLANTVKC
jgi:hypothetical protein